MNFLGAVPGLPEGQTLGIRPEHLKPAGTGQISGVVTHVERLGGDTNLMIRTDQGEDLTVRRFGQDPTEVGAKAILFFDEADAFRFNAAGERIVQGQA
jgi:multiple sugar transport system ATP-binding protein